MPKKAKAARICELDEQFGHIVASFLGPSILEAAAQSPHYREAGCNEDGRVVVAVEVPHRTNREVLGDDVAKLLNALDGGSNFEEGGRCRATQWWEIALTKSIELWVSMYTQSDIDLSQSDFDDMVEVMTDWLSNLRATGE